MKKRFSKEAFFLWLVVWIGGIVIFSVPHIFYGIMDSLRINRTADFFVSAALIFLTTMIFHMYVKVKNMEEKMESMVRKLSYDELEEKKK